MRTHANTARIASTAVLCLLAVTVPASAQISSPSPDFLVDGIAARQPAAASAAQGRFGASSGSAGIGFGVKGGVLFSSFRDATSPIGNSTLDYSNTTGWQAGIFIGGNRTGVLGLMTELTYAKRGAQSGSATTDTYYFEIPLLLRVNIGSSNRNKGVIVYAIGGPAADILLKAQLSGLDVKSQFKDVDWNVIGGGGIEISRLIIEGRFNWGLRNVLESPGSLKTQAFAVLGGIRFN